MWSCGAPSINYVNNYFVNLIYSPKLSINPGVTMWCICGCSWRDYVCCVCGCYIWGIVVMYVFWRRLCVRMIWRREIYLFWVGKGCDEWCGSVSSELLMCGGGACSILLLLLVPRNNRCMHMAHVCLYVSCGDCVGVFENVCCVSAVVENSFFSLACVSSAVL